MEEKTIKSCGDTMTKKCYLILKQLYGKEFAIEAIQSAPFFNQTKNETKSTSLE